MTTRIGKNMSIGKVLAMMAGAALPSFKGMLPCAMPQPRSYISGNRRPYTGEELREIRKRKGVGRPPVKMQRHGMGAAMMYPALVASHWGRPSPNLAEWQRKQRRGESNEDYRARLFGIREVVGYTDDELIHVGRPA